MRRTSPDRLYDAYIFDMDGTIYLGDDLLPGAKRLIEGLRELGRPVRFLSNNPTKDPQLYLEKLGKLGIPTPIEEIANTVVTTVRWLKANHPDAVVFPISEEPLKKALAEAGIADSAPFMAPMASRLWKPLRIESIEAAATSRSPLMMWIFAVIAARLPKGAGTVRGR